MMDNNFTFPFLSVLLAVKNESQYIENTLKMLFEQDYPKDKFEVIVADGCSDDNTADIVKEFAETHENCILLKNEKILSASGWNMGINKAKGNVISILSGHVELQSNYYSILVKYLTDDVSGVGGKAIPSGYDKRSRQIGRAFTSHLGSGGATYVRGNEDRYAETISYGCYWKKALQDIGGFDENIVRGQDWDMNLRLRIKGYRLFFVHDVEVKYFVRAKLSSLWKRQYLAGLWKLFINRKSKKHFLWRHAIPGMFAFVLTLLFLFSFVSNLALMMLLIMVVLYCLVIFWENLQNKVSLVEYPMMLVIYFIIHYAYGLGFILGIGKHEK